MRPAADGQSGRHAGDGFLPARSRPDPRKLGATGYAAPAGPNGHRPAGPTGDGAAAVGTSKPEVKNHEAAEQPLSSVISTRKLLSNIVTLGSRHLCQVRGQNGQNSAVGKGAC